MRLLIDAIPTKPGGGLTVLLGLLRGWRLAEVDLEIIVLAADEATEHEIRATQTVDRLERVDAGKLPWSHFLWQNLWLGRRARQLRADVLVGNNHFTRNIPCPQVVHHHNLWRFITPDLDIAPVPGWTDRVRDANARLALRKADANVFVSGFLRHQAETFVPDDRHVNYVVRNGLDDRVIDAALAGQSVYDGQPRLVAIQSANPHKDNFTMIDALAELVSLAPDVDWHLQVAGSAGRAGWSDVQRYAAQRNVGQRITWCGFCGLDRLDRILKQSLCLLATSVLEAGPLPVIEAMARHCVPVASRIPANVEFVGPAGILVTPRKGAEFAQAIWNLYRQPARRAELVALGQTRLGQFRWSACARQFYEILQKVAAGSEG